MATYARSGETFDRQGPARRATPAVMGAAVINFAAGIWLFVAHWVLGYASGDPIWNDVVFGLAIAVFALVRLSGKPMTRPVSLLNMAIGVWLVVAGLTITVSTAALVNNIACGAGVFLLALFAALFPSDEAL